MDDDAQLDAAIAASASLHRVVEAAHELAATRKLEYESKKVLITESSS
jgi:hypothetical protein